MIGPDGKEYCCEECARARLPEPCTPCSLSAQMRGEAQEVVEAFCEVVESNPAAAGSAAASVRAFCRERRRKLARLGGKALPGNGAARPSRPPRRRGAAQVQEVQEQKQAAPAAPSVNEERAAAEEATEAPLTAQEQAVVDKVCEIVEVAPGALGAAETSVRAFCRERRRTLARMGKKALTNGGSVLLAAKSGRERARQWRKERCRRGRGNQPPARPAGRMRKRPEAPPKVEVSQTLSGQEVTGTVVGRSVKVTGDEHGTCRVITGTEYLGAEQLASFCGATPAPNAPKVGESMTSHGKVVTGTTVGRSVQVTGDEHGSCVAVTGTEYMGVEQLAEFCDARGITPTPPKVAEAPSGKGLRITGVDEARSGTVTGLEQGLEKPITGTPYTVGAKAAEAPEKAPVTHTSTGRPVTGTLAVPGARVTGGEMGACKRITGTEYAPAEEVATLCGTMPEPNPPKVMVDATGKGLPVTGNLPARSPKVTGDEAGSCARLTGTPYAEPARQGLCAQGPEKVAETHTAHGQPVTGTEANPAPGMTGTGVDVGACSPVTGSQYMSAEAMQQTCGMTPPPAPQKVGVSTTWQGNPVTGAQPGPDPVVTGSEYGACQPVTGTGYVGREEMAMMCPPQAVQAGSQRLQQPPAVAGKPMTGIQPGPDQQVTGVIERGVCQPVSGTPYVGADQYAQACNVPLEATGQTAAPQGGFSIMTPAHAANMRRGPHISGSPYYADGKITGSASKGLGLITGTPEFRHPHLFEQGEAEMPEEARQPMPRVTGEATEPRRNRITGDDWSRSEVVTGTEGQSAAVRNPTRRGGGEPEKPRANARSWMRIERLEVPEAPITGSAGNTNEGAVVTVSGGARG